MSELTLSNAPESDTNDTLPIGWRQVSLAEVAEIKISNVDKKSAVGEIPVRLCNYIDVYKNVYITAALDFMEATATASEIARFCVERGDVMITKDSETPDDIGVPAVAIWSDPKLVCGYHLALFKPHRDQIDPVFLAKQLRLPRIAAYYGRLACGSTRYGLSNSGIARTPLRLPPLAQQRKIARILTTVDNLIEKTEALIAKYQAIKQGMMHDLFTRGVDEHGHLRPPYEQAPELYKQSELGWIPREWETAKVSNLAEIRVSNVDKKTSLGEIPVRLCNYIDVYKNEYITAALNFMEASATPVEIARFAVEVGDVMITKDSETPDDIGVPSVAVWSDARLVCGYHLALFKPDKHQVEPVFLAKQLKLARIAAYFGRLACGSTRYGLSNSGIAKTPLKLPPLSEQRQIAGILTTQDRRIDTEYAYLAKVRHQKSGLMQDLLAGKVLVKVDKAEEVSAHA